VTLPTGAEGLGESTADERAASDVRENYTPPSTGAAHRYGVLYQGEFETVSDGTALAVRLHARALAATGIPLLLRSFSGMVVTEHGVVEPVFRSGLPTEVDAEVGHLLKSDIAEFRPAIKHAVIRSPEHLRQMILPRYELPGNMEQQLALRDVIYGNTIVYSVWERDRIDPGIARHLSRVKQCWVPCRQNAQLLTDAGVPADRVHVVPHPYTDDDQIHLLTRRPADRHQGWRRFYSIGRWEPRKGFVQLIEAFLRAFDANDKVSLTIKYSGGGWPGYLSPMQALAAALLDAPVGNGWTLQKAAERVTLIDGRLARSQIVGLHLENNIYVSASHGEAWGLPAFDAKLAGNRLVYVGFGGVCDFAADEDILVPWELEPVHDSYRWEHGARWASYQLSDLVKGLQRARLPEPFARPPGFEDKFSMRAVGEKMRIVVDAATPRISTLPPE